MDNNINKESNFARLNQVTVFSKYFALFLFGTLPFIGGYIGYNYALCQMDTVVVPDDVGSKVIVAEQNVSAVDIVFAEETDFYLITTRYPDTSLDTKGVMASYVRGLISQKQTEWQMGGEMQLAEAKATEDFPDRPKITYVLDVRYSSSTNEDLGTVSYVFSVSEMTGGASGNVLITTFTFDKNGRVAIEDVVDLIDGKDLSLTKLLAQVGPKQTPDAFLSLDQLFSGLGLAYLKADGITLDKEACNCDGYFFGSNVQNFSITDTGLTFIFSKYAIAPGAVMTPEISLTWVELVPYLTAEFAAKLAN